VFTCPGVEDVRVGVDVYPEGERGPREGGGAAPTERSPHGRQQHHLHQQPDYRACVWPLVGVIFKMFLRAFNNTPGFRVTRTNLENDSNPSYYSVFHIMFLLSFRPNDVFLLLK